MKPLNPRKKDSINQRVRARALSINKIDTSNKSEIAVKDGVDYFFKLSSDYTVDFANTNMCQLLGYLDHEIVGLSSEIFVHPDLPNCLYEKYITQLYSKEPFDALSKVMTRNGDYFWLLMHFEKKLNKENEVISINVHSEKPKKKNTNKITNLYKILSKIEAKTGDTVASKRYLIGLFEDLQVTFDEYISSLCETKTVECLKNKEKVVESTPIITKRIVSIEYNPDMDMYH